MIIAALFLGAVACYFASLFALKYFRLLKFSAQMPGPRGLPLLGNALDLANKSSLGEMTMKKFTSSCRKS